MPGIPQGPASWQMGGPHNMPPMSGPGQMGAIQGMEHPPPGAPTGPWREGRGTDSNSSSVAGCPCRGPASGAAQNPAMKRQMASRRQAPSPGKAAMAQQKKPGLVRPHGSRGRRHGKAAAPKPLPQPK
jgi:hypothetical protein